jgi:hypothetical protein
MEEVHTRCDPVIPRIFLRLEEYRSQFTIDEHLNVAYSFHHQEDISEKALALFSPKADVITRIDCAKSGIAKTIADRQYYVKNSHT